LPAKIYVKLQPLHYCVDGLVPIHSARRYRQPVRETNSASAGRLEKATDEESRPAKPLTGLPNRAAFTSRSREQLTAGLPVTVLIVKLDGFRDVNDQLGHEIGDRLLTAASAARRPCDRPTPRSVIDADRRNACNCRSTASCQQDHERSEYPRIGTEKSQHAAHEMALLRAVT
jgi:hypothetical protein